MGLVAHKRVSDKNEDFLDSLFAARAQILDAALAREYDLTGDVNFTKRVLALAERNLEHPVKLRDD